MSWENVDGRALSLEEVFLSREFGQVHRAQQVVDGPPRSQTAAAGHSTTTHWRRKRAVGAASGLAAALFVALGLVTGSGTGKPRKPGGVKGGTTETQAAPPAGSVGGTSVASAPIAEALAATPVGPPSSLTAVRTSAPIQRDFPTPPTVPPPAPAPATPPPAGPPSSARGDLVTAASVLIDGVVNSAGNVITGAVSDLGTPSPLPPVAPLPSVVGALTASPLRPPLSGRAPVPVRYHRPVW